MRTKTLKRRRDRKAAQRRHHAIAARAKRIERVRDELRGSGWRRDSDGKWRQQVAR